MGSNYKIGPKNRRRLKIYIDDPFGVINYIRRVDLTMRSLD